MKPGFALRLDHDAVSLLVRVTEGWAELGRADVADPGFDEQLAGLRERAAELAPDGFTTKLILPADQILYTSADAPGRDSAARRARIATALDGRTPYAVEDLVFDWSGEGQNLSVAVVARLTLDEAEDFAKSHGFNPVAFVAVPEPGQFTGEPFFGLTATAAAHLPAGEAPTRDRDPVRIVDAPPPAPRPTVPPAGAPGMDERPSTDETDSPDPAEAGDGRSPDTGAEPQLPPADADDTADAVPGSEAERPLAASDPGAAEDGAHPSRGGLGITDGLVPDAAADLSETDIVMTDAADAVADELSDELGPEPDAADAEAPFIAVDELPEIEDFPAPPPVAAVAPAFSTRRSRPAGAEAPAEPPAADNTLPTTPPPALGNPVNRDVAGPDLPVPANDEAPPPSVKPPHIRKPSAKLDMPDARHGTTAQLRAERLMPEPKRVNGSAPPFALPVPPARQHRARLGLAIILVSLLVLILAAVSLWSFWFASAPSPTPENEVEVVLADPAPVSPDMAEPQTAPTTDPAPQTSTVTDITEPERADPPAAATIWADSPADPSTPSADATGAPAISDAAAPDLAVTETVPLAPPAETVADAALPLQPLPPPFGTEFDFRPDGLIRATEEGVVTPDGITLFAGRPPVVPSPRPAAIVPARAVTPPDDAGAADPDTAGAADNDASAVPPADAGTVTAGATPLPPPVDPAHAALKPRARPASVVAAAAERAAREAAEAEALARAIASATPQAVATSQRPKARPKGLVRIVATPSVDDAVAAAMASSIAATVPAPAPAPAPAAAPAKPEEIDEPEPVAATPNIPTSTTVAKQATVANAISLREINLIGVYGSSSSRRALIRMGNGRYVKVKIGDRLDGGQVAAIGDRELSYVKRGKTIVLKIEGEG